MLRYWPQSRQATADRASTCSGLCLVNVKANFGQWMVGSISMRGFNGHLPETHPTCFLHGLRFAICSLRAHSSASDGYETRSACAVVQSFLDSRGRQQPHRQSVRGFHPG